MDPRVSNLLRVQKLAKNPPLREGGVAASRARYRTMCEVLETPEKSLPGYRQEQLELKGGSLGIRVHHPAGFERALPFILYLHGGGFVIGDLDTHDNVCRRLARSSGAAVVALDYRLAPEHPLPAAVDDCAEALDTLRERAEQWCLDPERVATAGDSAGGNLSAVISPGRGLRMQLLYYPATDASAKTASKRDFADDHGLEQGDIDFFMEHYASGVDQKDPRLSPRYSPRLAESPPTRLVLAGFDPLRDEAREFADVLRDEGVPVELIERTGWIHGFVHMPALPGVKESMHEDALALARALASQAQTTT